MTLATDTFTDSNGTNITAHTMNVGPGWVVQQGAFDIQSNQFHLSSSAGDGQNRATVNINNGVVDVKATLIGGASRVDARVLANFVDTSNYWLMIANQQADTWYLYEINGGGATVRASSSPGPALSATYVLDVIANGDTISLRVGGTQILTYTVASRPFKTATRHGLGIFQDDNSSRFDDFSIDVLSPIPRIYIARQAVMRAATR